MSGYNKDLFDAMKIKHEAQLHLLKAKYEKEMTRLAEVLEQAECFKDANFICVRCKALAEHKEFKEKMK